VRWRWAGAVALSRDAHLSDDEAIANMGHPEVGHPPQSPKLQQVKIVGGLCGRKEACADKEALRHDRAMGRKGLNGESRHLPDHHWEGNDGRPKLV
jgi:hypothetical protein